MARAVGAIGVGIESAISSARSSFEAGATAVYPGVADLRRGAPRDRAHGAPSRASRPPDDAGSPGGDPRGRRRPGAVAARRGVARLGGGVSSSSPPTAARATRWTSACRSIAGSATAIRSIRPTSPPSPRPASRSIRWPRRRTSPTPSSRSLAALAAGADSIVLLGALGGPRVDHALANLGLLAQPGTRGPAAWLFDEHAARCSLLAAPGAGRRP